MTLTFAITIVVLLAVAAYAASRRSARAQSVRGASASPVLPPPHEGFFGRWMDDDEREPAPERPEAVDPRRAELLERAAAGELEAFDAALDHDGGVLLLEVTDALSVACEDDAVQPLASRVARAERPRGSAALARRAVYVWTDRAGRRELSDLLAVAAMSHDADAFDDAICAAADSLRSGALEGVSAKDFLSACERHFRTMPDAARNSGQGFVVKRRLAELSRTLAAPDGR